MLWLCQHVYIMHEKQMACIDITVSSFDRLSVPQKADNMRQINMGTIAYSFIVLNTIQFQYLTSR